MQIVVKRWQEKAAAHPSFLSDAQAGTNSKNNNDNFMRKSHQYFLSRFLDTGLPLFNIYSKAGTNSKNNNDNFMRKSRQYFLSRFLDTGLPLFNIYYKFQWEHISVE